MTGSPDDAIASRLLSAKQAATLLGISARTLWSLTAARQIPHLRIGRVLRYPVPDLLAWIEARKVRETDA